MKTESLSVEKYLLMILVFMLIFSGFIITPSVYAVEEDRGELILSAGTLQGVMPRGKITMKNNLLALSGSYASMPYSWQDYSGDLNLWQLSARVYSPVSYRGTDFYLEGGIARASYELEGAEISSPGYQGNLGFERDISDRLSWGGQLGYLYLPPEELDSQFVAGISLNYSLSLGEPPAERTEGVTSRAESKAAEYSREKLEDTDDGQIIRAEGRIDGLNVPYSVSGSWSFSANFAEEEATLSVSGNSEGGSFSHSISGEPRRSGNGVSFRTSMSGTHNDMSVSANIRVSVDPSSLSIRVNASREDGLEMSARGSGTTTSYED